MRRTLFFALALAACSAASEHADQATPAPAGSSTGVAVVDTGAGAVVTKPAPAVSTTPAASPTPAAPTASRPIAPHTGPRGLDPRTSVIRALYVNRFAAQSRKRMAQLIAMADQTEINGLVIDMKDEFGLNFDTTDPEFKKNAGTAGVVRDLRTLLDTLRAHDILPIARIVVFKDSVTARVHPEWTIRRTDNSIWRDKQGLAWVNPYHRELWDYNIGIAEELVALGFQEVQFDYIRFPEPYKSLPQQVFPNSGGLSKPDALAEYLKTAKQRLNRVGVRSTADIFGLVTTVGGPLEVGQWWEKVSPHADVLLPMVYPSHYPRGSFGLKSPNAQPYETIKIAIDAARKRDEKLGITVPEHVRPWLQAFTLGAPPYGPEQIEAQKKAVYDAGYDGWVLWHPGSKYEPFLPGLEKEFVSRKK
jgi:hypothetical protein